MYIYILTYIFIISNGKYQVNMLLSNEFRESNIQQVWQVTGMVSQQDFPQSENCHVGTFIPHQAL